jgi:hypothetical protein
MLPTYYKDGLLFFKEKSGVDSILGDRLIIDSGRIGEICDYVNKHKIKSVTINSAYFKLANLDFLNDIPFVEGIFIVHEDLDLSILNSLRNLRVLRIGETDTAIDFKNFPNLEVLGATYNEFIVNVSSCKKLFWLWFDEFREDSLQKISALSMLEYLNLYKTTIRNLEGFSLLTKVKEVHIDAAPRLESCAGISESNSNLAVVDIYNAKKLSDYRAIGNTSTIKKIFFTKTGDIPNLSFLNNLPDIESVVIGSKILDGDTSYLQKVPNVNFKDFPHYSHKLKDLT